jgi:hypothetical protein
MSPRIKWGLVTGAVIAVLNLCGGALIGALNNCLSFITVIIASAIAGYLCARYEPASEATKAGAVAGAIVGGLNLISQLIGGLIGGIIGSGILAAGIPDSLNSPEFVSGVGIGMGIIVIAAIIIGAILILVGAGVGALTAKLSLPKGEQ